MSTRGVFVAFEGIDGSGKSTQARRVAAAHAARYTFEPGDTPLGGQLRAWLLDADEPMSPATEALLMLADRAHHVATVIAPTLAAGTSVIADRFAASTLAYQGAGRGLDRRWLQAATRLAVGTCVPDLTVLVDVPIEVAAERRGDGDRFESEEASFHEAVRRGFLDLAVEGGHAWAVVDGTGTIDEVIRRVDACLASVRWPA